MTWHLYPLYILITLISCTSALFIAIKAWQRRHIPGALPTVILMVGICFWSMCACLEDSVAELAGKLFFYNAEFVCFTAVPLIWVSMLLDYLGYRRLLSRRNVIIAAILPCICILLCWTNDSHHFIFSQRWIEHEAGIPYLEVTYNLGFWIYVIYSYVLVSIGMILCLLGALSSVKIYRQQAIVLLLGGVVPIIASIFDITYSIWPAWNITPQAFLVTGGLMILGMYKWRLWDLAPVAYQAMIQKMIDGIVVIDLSRRIVEINPVGCGQLGVSPTDLIGQPIEAITAIFPEITARHLSDNDVQIICEVPEPHPTAYDVRITPLFTAPAHSSGWLVVLRDITERRQLEQQLFSLAYFDALTGLPNRVLLRDRLEQVITRNRRNGSCAGVIFIDLDRFKEINDTHGHSIGDAVLQQAGQRLKDTLRASDTVARFGGDEFVLILPDIQFPAMLVETAQRILTVFQQPFHIFELSFELTPSMGLTMTPADGETVDDLLRNADIAMYRAKSAGGAGFAFYADLLAVNETLN